jgi:hypothetical protein
MPRYVVERSFARITEEEFLAAAVRSDQSIAEGFPEITWEHSHVCAAEDGGITTFCIYGAANEEMIRDHADTFGSHTVVRIYELLEDITPLDVRRRAASS